VKNWIRKKTWDFLNQNSNKPGAVGIPMPLEKIHSDGINIAIHNATGGTIVEFRSYNRPLDQPSNKLYVIPSDQNFSEQFVKIVTMEMMR